MPFSTYTANKILDCYLRGVAITPPTRVWVSLHTADPGDAGGNEVPLTAWPSYQRRDPSSGGTITNGFSAAANKAIENSSVILFPEHNGAGPVTLTHVAIWDAPMGGNCLLSGPLNTTRVISPTDEIAIRAGDLDCMVA